MQTKFKRHQPVRLLIDPDPEYVEYHEEFDNEKNMPKIVAGMEGRVNIILPNGQYHVQIENKKGEVIAYCSVSEDDLEAI